MLDNVSSDVHKYYFDQKVHDLDWDALVRQTRENIDRAPDMDTANAEIEALLEKLNDSHTNFIAPRNTYRVDYGWSFRIIGNRGFITKVKARSDAETKGVRPGDELLTIDGFTVDRVSAPKLKYAIYEFFPRKRLQLTLRDRAGKLLDLTVDSEIKEQTAIAGLGGSSWYRNQNIIDAENYWDKAKASYKDLGPELMILRIPAFYQMGFDVDNLMGQARAHKTLIVDLRGTPGGTTDSVLSYLGNLFDHDMKIGDWIKRNKVSPIMVKSRGQSAFTGNLILLVDSETASGGEILARTVQIQKRGTLLGDHTSGRTMASQFFVHKFGINPMYIYGDSVTISDTKMVDGKSLENIGVEPDQIILPSAGDLAAGRDSVLAYAAGLAGVKMSPEDAAKLFPSTALTE